VQASRIAGWRPGEGRVVDDGLCANWTTRGLGCKTLPAVLSNITCPPSQNERNGMVLHLASAREPRACHMPS